MAKFGQLKKINGWFLPKKQNLQKKEIFRKFEGLGVSKCTLNRLLDRLQKNKTPERKKRSHEVAKKVNNKVIKAIKSKLNRRHGYSQRKFEVSSIYHNNMSVRS